MYQRYYGFRDEPFSITPNPRFLFLSEQHREALSHLLFGVTERKGFIQLTGEVGAGKTTLCRALLEALEPKKYTTALILNPCLSRDEFLKTVLLELGVKPGKQNKVEYLDKLNRFLLAEAKAGRDVVLLIDEAQDLTVEMLEEIRLLSNLETDQRKLLQIVLMGQPELRDKLDDPRLRQLRQRITVRYHLHALSRREVRDYIEHRLKLAGEGPALPRFSDWAVRKIHGYSGGIPRLVNAVCDKTLLCGYVEGTDQLNWWHVRRAIRELEGKAA